VLQARALGNRNAMGAVRARLPVSREDRLAVYGLAAILGLGALLRLVFVLGWQPALFGWPDAASYIDVSQGQLFGNELRPAGYSLLLRLLHDVAPSLVLLVVLQHLLGLAAALLLYASVVRAGAPRAFGLVPAAVVALGGDGIFLEHSPISESVFIFLVAAVVYAGVRSLGGESLRWPLALGAIVALAATVRVVALPLLPLLGIWIMGATSAPLRRRAALFAAGALGALAILGPYYVAEDLSVGKTGLSRNGIWNLYGRVAPFANCSKFKPPSGTEALCETTPRWKRPLTYQYTFNWYFSPAIRVLANPHVATPAQTRTVAAWSWAVIRGQPLDYAEEVGAGLLRYVAPNSLRGYGGGPSYRDLVNKPVLFHPAFQREGLRVASKWYPDAKRYERHRWVVQMLRGWESITRVQGPIFVLFALLSIAAPFATRGPARSASILFALVAWTLLVTPVATVEFSARTAVPGFGALSAAGAMGGWQAAAAVRRRRGSPAEPMAQPI
jgi:hypothetical protein